MVEEHDMESQVPEFGDEVVDRETAERDFEIFAQFARLRLESFRSEDDQQKIEAARERMIENIMLGRITVDEEGRATCYTENPKLPKIVFSRRPKNHDKAQMDKCKLTALGAKEFAWVASVIGVNSKMISGLEQHDWRMIKEVFDLFLDE